MIYLDHNATTPIDKRVFDAMTPYLQTFYGNPSSLHRHGRTAKTAIENAREQVAKLVGVTSSQVIFTSGGTEANNLALSSLTERRLLVGATEHPSVMQPSTVKKASKCQLIPVNHDGLVDIEALRLLINKQSCIISLMHANNETGVIQDIQHISSIINDNRVVLHTDAVQSAGKVPVDFDALNVDLMSLSSHKIYGPKGVGAVIVSEKIDIHPLVWGGGQEHELRPGTENVAGIVGFGQAAELARLELVERASHMLSLLQLLEANLKKIPGLSIVAETTDRLPNTCQIIIDQLDGEMLLMLLDKASIAVSSGSACASKNTAPSPILMAMGYTKEQANSSLRISLGKDNTKDDVRKFSTVLLELVEINR